MIGVPGHAALRLLDPRRFLVVLGSAFAVFMVVALAASVVDWVSDGGDGLDSARSGDQSLERQRREFVAYEAEIERLTEQGANLVVLGMRPGVADIADGRFPDQTLVTMAEGWTATARQLGQDFADLTEPEFAAHVGLQFDLALDAYVRTAELLLAAARAPVGERAALVDAAADLGERADDLLDRSMDLLGRERARLGLGTGSPERGGV